LNTTYANRTDWINLLNPNTTSGYGLKTVCGAGLVILYMAVPCPAHDVTYNYIPSAWADAIVFQLCDPVGSTSCSSNSQSTAHIGIVRDGVSLNQGSGGALQQGYSSVGVGSSKGGSALLLQIRSQAVAASGAQAVTIAQYKVNVVN